MREGPFPSPASAADAPPERILRCFAVALGAGDLDGATACFVRDACLITPDATTIRGRTSIRPVLAQLVLVRTEIAIQFSTALVVADAALLRGRWAIRSNGADGAHFEQITSPIVVAHRIEAQWKLQIVAPWG
jgi:ketosteroid isomerase-like protein